MDKAASSRFGEGVHQEPLRPVRRLVQPDGEVQARRDVAGRRGERAGEGRSGHGVDKKKAARGVQERVPGRIEVQELLPGARDRPFWIWGLERQEVNRWALEMSPEGMDGLIGHVVLKPLQRRRRRHGGRLYVFVDRSARPVGGLHLRLQETLSVLRKADVETPGVAVLADGIDRDLHIGEGGGGDVLAGEGRRAVIRGGERCGRAQRDSGDAAPIRLPDRPVLREGGPQSVVSRRTAVSPPKLLIGRGG
jgi:hypothetical protein